MKQYSIKGRDTKKYLSHFFTRVIKQFKKNGGHITVKKCGKSATESTPEAQALVKEKFLAEPQISIRYAARALDFSKTTLHRIVKTDLKMKPYKFCQSQELFEDRVK